MPKAKILVIDDERNTREGLAAALGDRYDVLLAEDALKGMRILKEQNISIVLTDLRMSGLDGMEFTREVSTWPKAPLIIMLTAYGSVETAIEAMKVGAYDYLTKPINLDDLEMMIERGLETVRMRNGEDAVLPRTPMRFTGFAPEQSAVAVMPGDQTDGILGQLGYSAEKIAEMKANGAIK